MPLRSKRDTLLKDLERQIAYYKHYTFDNKMLDLYLLYVSQYLEISSTRYLERQPRGPGYERHPSTLTYQFLTESRPDRVKRLFRMTIHQLDQITSRFESHPIFNCGRGRPQAPPERQLAILIHRLASGHENDTIADLFRVSKGSVDMYCRRAAIAIGSSWHDVIKWPEPTERALITSRIEQLNGIPDCLGFIDGTLINLDRAPSRGPGNSSSFYSRKGRYGFLYVAIVDDTKRFRFIHYGFSASASDMRAQRVMSLTQRPQDYFEGREHVIGDSGFADTDHIVAMYKRQAGKKHIYGRQAFFNAKAARCRVMIEHAFGILKARWTALRNLRCAVKDEEQEAWAHSVIQAAFILHNLTVSTWRQFVTEAEVMELSGIEQEAREAAAAVYDGQTSKEGATSSRREVLVEQMLALDPPAVPVDSFYI